MSLKKPLILVCILSAYLVTSYSQNRVVISDKNDQEAHESAILEIISESKGFLFPRLSEDDRNSINDPAESLIIFNKDSKCIEIWVDNVWQELWCSDCPNPVAPIASGATNISEDEFTANWSAVSSDPPLINYLLDVSTDDEFNTYDVYEKEDVGLNTQYVVQGLNPDTEYFYRVFAVNECGSSSASNVVPVTTEEITSECVYGCDGVNPPTIDGYTYDIIQIGDQCWFAENINVGNRIDTGSGQGQDCENIEKFCFQNDPDNCDIYGGMYQWNQAMCGETTERSRGICPGGWVIPSEDDFDELEDYLIANNYNCGADPNDVAKALASEDYWDSSNEPCAVGNDDYANNASCFTGLPAGNTDAGDSFHRLGETGYWWTSNENPDNTSHAWYKALHYANSVLGHNALVKTRTFSVRCIRECCNGLCVGDEHEGGIIAYFFKEGDSGYVDGECHGIIAATNDQPNSQWGCRGKEVGSSAQGQEIGDGFNNTMEILAFHDDGDNFDCDNYYEDEEGGSNNCGCSSENDGSVAAKICYELDENGYNDWFLPSRNELKTLFDNLYKNGYGNFETSLYWTSTEHSNPTYSASDALVGVPDGEPIPFGGLWKSDRTSVRCIRNF